METAWISLPAVIYGAGSNRIGNKAAMSGIHKKTYDQTIQRDDDLSEWQRRQDLYRAYDGPIPPRMMARSGDGDVRLDKIIREAEDRASHHEDAAERWLDLGKPEMARRCREDAKLARDTATLNRDALEKLRNDRARACPGHDPGADQAGEGETA